MFRISTMNKIAAVGLDRFDRGQYEVASDLNNPDAVIVRSAKLHDMEMPETLKAIARAGAGVNNIPVAECTAKGIVVFNTPGANANAVKELVIAALLLSSRGIIKGVEWTNTLKGSENISKQVEDGKKNFARNQRQNPWHHRVGGHRRFFGQRRAGARHECRRIRPLHLR